MKALWVGKTLAESNSTVVVENNHYFPADSINMEFLKKNGETYTCPWKGTCDYYNVEVNGNINKNAAWSYPDPKDAAKEIKNRFAFWKGVEVKE